MCLLFAQDSTALKMRITRQCMVMVSKARKRAIITPHLLVAALVVVVDDDEVDEEEEEQHRKSSCFSLINFDHPNKAFCPSVLMVTTMTSKTNNNNNRSKVKIIKETDVANVGNDDEQPRTVQAPNSKRMGTKR